MPCRAWYRVGILIIFNSYLTTEELPAEKKVAQVIDNIHHLLYHTEKIEIDDIDFVCDQINDILVRDRDDVELSGELMELLNAIGARVELNGSFVSTTIKNNIAMLIVDTTQANHILGITVYRRETDNFTDDSVQILDSNADPDVVLDDISEMVILLPASVIQQSDRIIFVILRDDRVFKNSYDIYTDGRRMARINVQNDTDLGLNEQIIYGKGKVGNTDNYGCTYWNFLQNGAGFWSAGDCSIFLNPPQLFMCRCRSQPVGYFARNRISEDTTNEAITIATTSTLSPEDQLQKVLDHVQQLLENAEGSISMDDVNQAIDQVNDVLQLDQDDLEFPSALLHMIEQLGTKANLNGTYTEAVVRDNVALLIADITPENKVVGIALANRDTDTFTEDAFDFLSNINSSVLSLHVNEAVVSLPLSVTEHAHRITFIVFRDTRIFNYNRELYSINGRVIGIKMDNCYLEKGEVVDIYLKPMAVASSKKKHVCTYWNMSEDGTGIWSQEGCIFIESRDPREMNKCRFQHLTYFAEKLISICPIPYNDNILSAFAVIGSVLSLVSIIIIVLTAVLFSSWRKDYRNQIWLQLCVASSIISISHITMIFVKFHHFSVLCLLTGIMLHFSVVAAYCCMLTAGFKALSELLLPPNKNLGLCVKLLFSLFMWGIPIVKVTLMMVFRTFAIPLDDTHPLNNFCKPVAVNLWLVYFTPTAILMISTWTVFFYVIYKLDIGPSSRNEEISDINRDTLSYARVGLGLALLAGLPPWLFNIFSYNIVGAYLFTITVTTQGVVLFVFVICGNQSTRNLWLHKLNIRAAPDSIPLTRSLSEC